MLFDVLILLLPAAAAAIAAVIFDADVQSTGTDQALAAGTEAIIQQGLSLPLQPTTGKAAIIGMANFTLGAAATSMTLRIRRGNALTGTAVGTTILAATAATFTQASAQVTATDALNNVAGAQYCLTAQVAADVATVKSCILSTSVLSG